MGILRAGVILHTRDHVLLVRTRHKDRSRCVWGFPKGRVQDGEGTRKQSTSSEEEEVIEVDIRQILRSCAEREFYEETGIHIELAENCPVVRVANVRLFIQMIDHIFPLYYQSIPDKHEILDIRWIPWTELIQGTIPMNHSLRSYLKKKQAATTLYEASLVPPV
jgi:8-oxo-dGTP pyrophosphatase MutT (NUDIX family)